jgi:hypothetical protein
VSGSYFVDALALLLKLAEYHIEALLHILDAPISMSTMPKRVAPERGGFEPPTPGLLTKRTSSSTS